MTLTDTRARRTRPLARPLARPVLLLLLALLVPLAWVTPAEAALDLRQGSRGAAVRTVEGRLATLGLLRRARVDRVYRLATVRAVRSFQRQERLRVTGRVDRRTWDAIARAVAPKPAAPLPPVPVIVGHRGDGGRTAPENTLAAMVAGAEVADVLELDLRATSDHVLVLMHDTTLDRTTNCTGPVSAWTHADLTARCTVSGEPVPTFEEVAAFVATTSLSLSPELRREATPEDLSAFVATLRAHGLVGRTYAQSFDAATLRSLAAVDPAVRRVFLGPGSTPVSVPRDLGATVMAVNLTGLTAARVAEYQRAGMRVWPWTAVTEEQLRALRAMRVDGIVTDIPAAARRMFSAAS
ncbi:hypothetical protein ASG49_14650 [Marmoricola sp. Leaf446]|uniref:glycerophosphodiester phosphodiesterase family protein n=1 Tax=Marmoricola sp. Leaf446 TaxID=1736379 RepID=UPI0006FC180C|nr:glycerophosphodiester phosphodiesterase family protein [Marmoricola sp. Leaf446]KQT89069.1 hypothetical protein ASG49_14650 [Marmoricola sp. Leaf446]